MDVLLERPPWYVVGPLLGLVVVAVLATMNERLGVVGGYAEVVERVARRSLAFGWKTSFLLGIVAGGLVFALLGGPSPARDGYGALGRALEGSWQALVAPVLLAAGVLIGYGARTAGGCTSGHGLCGSSLGSLASVAATMTFTATAIVTAFATRWLVGS